MAHWHGKAAKVTVGGADLKGAGSWEINHSGDVGDTTGMDSAGVAEFVAGVTSWTGSVDVTYDSGDLPHTSLAAGVSFTFAGFVMSSSTYQFIGDAIVTNFRFRADITDKITYAFDFQGTGALTGTGL